MTIAQPPIETNPLYQKGFEDGAKVADEFF